MEAFLADRIIASAWRLRRVAKVEVAVFQSVRMKADSGVDGIEHDQGIGEGFIRDGYQRDAFTRLSRYEAGIERAMFRALHELQRLQASRQGVPTPPPVALDVTVTGSAALPANE